VTKLRFDSSAKNIKPALQVKQTANDRADNQAHKDDEDSVNDEEAADSSEIS